MTVLLTTQYLEEADQLASRVAVMNNGTIVAVGNPRELKVRVGQEVLEVRERDGSVTVTVRERTPKLGERGEPRVTFPYRLLSLPAERDVYVDWRGR